MQIANTAYILPLILASLTGLSVAAYAWSHRTVQGASTLAVLALAVAEWTLGYALEIAGADLPTKLFWAKFEYIGIVSVPLLWLIFSYSYFNPSRKMTGQVIAGLSIIPLATLLLVFTTERHGLVWSEYFISQDGSFSSLGVSHGLWFWVYWIYANLLLLAGTYFIVRSLSHKHGLYRGQIVALVLALLAPWLGNFLYVSGVIPVENLDPTPFGFTITVVLTAWAIFRFQLINLSPVARDAVIDAMEDGMIVIDVQGRVVDINPAAARVICLSESYAVGKTARDVFRPWPSLFEKLRHAREGRWEIVLGEGEARRHYEVTFSPLYDPQHEFAGRVILLHALRPGSSWSHEPATEEIAPMQESHTETLEETGHSVQSEGDPLSDMPFVGWLTDSFLAPDAIGSRSSPVEQPGLTVVSERAFTALLRLAALLTLSIVLLSQRDFERFPEGFIALLAIEFGLGILALVRAIPFKVRILGFLCVGYLFGVIDLVSFGFAIKGFMYLWVVILAAAILTSRRTAWTVFFLIFTTLAAFGLQMNAGSFTPLGIAAGNSPIDNSLDPAPILVTFASGSAVLGVAISLMWTNLSRGWQREKQTASLLRQERDFLDQRVRERARELALSEAKYRTLVEQLPVVVYQDEANQTHTNSYVSPQIEGLTGYSPAEFEQDPLLWQKIVLSEDREEADSIAREVLTRGYSTSEYRLVRRDGFIVWIRDEALLVQDEANGIRFIQGIMQDITARKQTESSLSQSEARYRGLFEDSPISLWEEDLSEVKNFLDSLRQQGVKDFERYLDAYPAVVQSCVELVRVIDVNKATLQMYGVSSKRELPGKLSSLLGPSGLSSFRALLVHIAAGKTEFEWTGHNYNLNGNEIDVHLHWSTLPGYEGDLSRVIISVQDITKLKRAEKELNRHNRQLEALHQVSLALLDRMKMDDLLQSIVDYAAILLEAPFCEIMLEEKGELVVRAYTSNQPYLKGDRVGREQAMLSWQAYDTGEPVIVDDYATWPGHRALYDEVCLQAVADFPIMIGQRSLGVLGIGRSQAGYGFDDQHVRIGVQFAQIAALVLNNVQLLEESSLQVAALNATANAIMLTDRYGKIQWVNSGFANLTGYNLEDVVGKNPRILQSGSTQAELYADLWKTILSGQHWHGELYNRRKDGTDFVEEMTITPLLDDHGDVYRFIAVMQDISERKGAEEALRISEEKYRSIFENVEDVFYTTDYNGHIVTVSPSIEKHSGYRPEDILGRHVRSFFVNEADYEKLDYAVSTLGALNDYEMVMKRKDGSLIYVSATARVVFDANGQPVGTEGVMRDISERKRNEIRERQRRALLERVMEMSKIVAQSYSFKECLTLIHQTVQNGLGFDRVGVFLYDEQSRMVHGAVGTSRTGQMEENTWFAQSLDEHKAWEVALNDPRGFYMLEDFDGYHRVPEKHEMEGVKQNILFSAWAGAKPVAFISADNLISQKLFTEEQLEALQLFAGYAGLAIENARWKGELENRVQERTLQLQESNANLSALVESSLALNKTLDLEQVLDHVLIQARKMVPCRTLSIMFREGDLNYVARRLGDPEIDLSNLKTPNSWSTFQQMITEQASVLIPDTASDPDWQHTSGSIWIRSYIGVPIIIHGETVGFLNANHDEADHFNETDMLLLEALASHASIALQNARLLGDVRQSLEKEQTMRAQLVHADKLAALGKMVAVIAHEINNPIQTVKNAFFLIEDEIDPDSSAQEYLRIAKSEATRISDLVSQLRETYRARTKTFARVELGSVISEVKSLLLPQLRKSNVIWNQSEVLPPCDVFATKGNLKQVFMNLGLNAIEAMEQGGQLTVSMELSQDGKNVGVRMHNTGPLIPEDDLVHIFEPFFTTKGSGSGLGLSISYDIVQQHRGTIQVECSQEYGVAFIVWLPLASDDGG